MFPPWMRRISKMTLLVLAFAATPTLARADDIEDELQKAQEQYATEEAKQRDLLAGFIKREQAKVQRSGNLEELKKVNAELEAFLSSAALPTCVGTQRYESQMERAKVRLTVAFEEAIRQYTQSGQVALAETVQKQLDDFKSSGGLNRSHPADAVEFGGRFYKAFPEVLSWDGALKKCVTMGGMLACPASAAENAFLVKLAAPIPVVDAVWLGSTDRFKEGNWIDSSGKKLGWENWGPQQPNNKQGAEHFAVLIVKRPQNAALIGSWSDQPLVSQQHKVGFVCVWEK